MVPGVATYGGGVSGSGYAWNNPQFVEIVLSYYRMRWGGAVGKPAYADLQARLTTKPEPKIAVPKVLIQGNKACDLVNGADGQESCFTQGYERIILLHVGGRNLGLIWKAGLRR